MVLCQSGVGVRASLCQSSPKGGTDERGLGAGWEIRGTFCRVEASTTFALRGGNVGDDLRDRR